MSHYYYFISTLPMLQMGKKPSIGYSEFMDRAASLVSKKDYEDLKKAVFTPTGELSSSPVVRAWQEYALKINSALAKIRSEKLGFPGYDSLPEDLLIRDRIRDIAGISDPLKSERAILSMYFDFLTSLEGTDPFKSDALIIYALKLRILERDSLFEESGGKEEFRDLYSSIGDEIFG